MTGIGSVRTERRLNTGLETLDRAECVEFLRTSSVGRLAMAGTGGRIEVFPVNYVLNGEDVVFRTQVGTKLAASSGQNVAFEVDCLDPPDGRPWSVVVHGTADRLDNLGSGLAGSQVALTSWVTSVKPHLLRVTADEITGRRILAPRL